ncbi:MAG: hypothetical protein AB7U75_02245 [Hyphomicrobiaceae bacterium]
MTFEREAARTMRRIGTGLVLAVAVALAACAGGNTPPIAHGKGMSCLDDSPHCIAERKDALRHIVSRSDRHWVRDPATVHSYASGVRLFAFKTRKKDLTCDELKIGRREAEGAARVLRGPEGRTLSPAQISRGVMLGEEVSRELAREHARRCQRG